MLSKLSFGDIQKPLFLSGAAIASGLAVFYLYKNYIEAIDLKWEEAGEVCQLLIHPVKSAGSIEVSKAYASKYGLSQGNILDRSFVVICGDIMVTGRDMPKLVTISPKFEGKSMTLTSLDRRSFTVDIGKVIADNISAEFKIRCTTVQGFDCGVGVGRWLSDVLQTGDKHLRLMYKGAYDWSRPNRKFPNNFDTMKDNDTTMYQDSSAYMVMTKSSVDDLNSRLEEPVDIYYFRPPITISGTIPYDEDTWSQIKIGKSVILRLFKPCERCLLTQRVPSTGEERTDHFEVLKSYRILTWPPKFAKQFAGKPILGAQCGIDSVGEIGVGDKVYIRRQEKPWCKIG